MTERQEHYLKLIIESYINDGQPVASSMLIKKYNLSISSATVRNEMTILEHEGMLTKHHISGGRVPSIKGLKYYAEFLSDGGDKDIEKTLQDIFAKRRISIDSTIEKAVGLISDITNMTLVTSSTDTSELLKSIQLTPLNKSSATIVLVTSSGRVESKLIEISDKVPLDDVRISIRLFKERLIDSPLKDVAMKIEALAPLLSKSVKNYEAVLEQFITKVFDFHNKIVNKVYGNSALIKANEIKREDLANILDMIEHKSIWQTIEGKIDEDETLKIDIRPNNTSIISKKIDVNNISKEISIIGTNRLNYRYAKQVLYLLEKYLKEK